MKLEVVVREDPDELARSAARFVVERLRAATHARGSASLALAGGSTPERLYQTLAAEHRRAVDWSRVHVFYGDERCVPLDSPDSNHALARATLLRPLAIPLTHVHAMPAMERPCDAAAVRYEKELRGFFAGEGTFDLALLGLGEDGHTASLFPGEPATLERERWVVHVETRAKPPPDRLTLTLPVFARAAAVAFLVAGDGKRSILERVLEPRTAADRALPAAQVRARQELSWFVDRAARG